MEIINREIKAQHPTQLHIKTVDLIGVFGKVKCEDANYQNIEIFGEGQADRSPCVTGTSAKVATLYTKGELNASIPEISGSAFITGFNLLIIDEEDPAKYGFLLK